MLNHCRLQKLHSGKREPGILLVEREHVRFEQLQCLKDGIKMVMEQPSLGPKVLQPLKIYSLSINYIIIRFRFAMSFRAGDQKLSSSPEAYIQKMSFL